MKEYIINEYGKRIVLDKSAIIKYVKKALRKKERLDRFGGSSLWCKAIFVAFRDLYNTTNINMFTNLFGIERNPYFFGNNIQTIRRRISNKV